jgi:hypothetical protein
MTSHAALMVVFAVFVSTIFATIAKDSPAEQAKLGAKMFGTFMAAALVMGWVMRIFPW